MAGESATGYRSLAVAPTLSRIARLQRERPYRDRYGFYFVEGIRNFVTAMDHGGAVDTLLYSERLLTQPIARKLVRQLKRSGIPFARASPEQFRSISLSRHASGVGVILRQHILDIQRVTPGDYPCWIVLDQVRTPGNFGTLIRTSAAVGAAGFILLGNKIDPFHPAVVRASMGALFRQTLVRTSAEQLQEWVQQYSLLVVGASPDGTLSYDQVRYSQPTVLVLGEERAGLTEEQRRLCQQIVRIPMVAETDSLNLGVAGSLLMYEVLRAAQHSQ